VLFTRLSLPGADNTPGQTPPAHTHLQLSGDARVLDVQQKHSHTLSLVPGLQSAVLASLQQQVQDQRQDMHTLGQHSTAQHGMADAVLQAAPLELKAAVKCILHSFVPSPGPSKADTADTATDVSRSATLPMSV
jgi:hypothetical protein